MSLVDWWHATNYFHVEPSVKRAFVKQLGGVKKGLNAKLDEYRDTFDNTSQIYSQLVTELGMKLDTINFYVWRYHLPRLVIEQDAFASVAFRGETYQHQVPGLLAFAGDFYLPDLRQVRRLSPVFVSHPFWQLRSFNSAADDFENRNSEP